MWFQVAATLLVATSCVYGQLRQDEVDQFTNAGGCTHQNGFIESQVSAKLSASGEVTIEANHVPNHAWQRVNPNCPKARMQQYSFKPPTPMPPGEEMCTNQGPIGIAKNGVYIFNPTAAGGGNAKVQETMDENHGHTAPQGNYHYHYLPDNKVIWDSSNPESQFVGIAFDGYPIYSEGRGVDTSKLDICRGMLINNRYTYIATETHYPYFLGCYHGKPQVERRGRGDEPGSRSCKGMKLGQACTCAYGLKSASKKRQLLDLLVEVARDVNRESETHNSKRQTGTYKTYCGAVGINERRPRNGTGGPGMANGGPGQGNGPPPQSMFQCPELDGDEGYQGGLNYGNAGQNNGNVGQNNGNVGQNNGNVGQNNGNNGLSGIPPWLIYLMWRQYSNQRNNQYGNRFGNRWGYTNPWTSYGNNYGYSRWFKRSEDNELDKELDNLFNDEFDEKRQSNPLDRFRSDGDTPSNQGSNQGSNRPNNNLPNNQADNDPPRNQPSQNPIADLLARIRGDVLRFFRDNDDRK